MRILVGTLYSGENEFDQSVNSVESQRYRFAEHLIIRGLPIREAANALFERFFSQPCEFDLLVKVDADMVLTNERVFEGIVNRFENDDALQLLSIGVHDFYTDQIIGSLNAYRSTIEWKPVDDRLAPDRVTVMKGRHAYDHRLLAPAAWHCPDPSPVQAFLFGLHRGAKAYAAAESREYRMLRAHLGTLAKTWRNYLRKGDRRLLLAALGGEMALRGRFGAQFVNYHDPTVVEAFRRYEHVPAKQLEAEVRRLRFRSFGFLPLHLRIEMLRRGRMTLPLRFLIPYAQRERTMSAVAKWSRRVGKRSRRLAKWSRRLMK